MNDVGCCPVVDAAWHRDHPLPLVDQNGDKEGRGHVLIIAGSREMPGAAVLAAIAAMRAGAGKLTVLTESSVVGPIAQSVPEARVVDAGLGELAFAGDQLTRICASGGSAPKAVLIGPGMTEKQCLAALAGALRRVPDVPLVLDAAAIATIAGFRAQIEAGRRPVIITPHAGEMSALSGWTKEQVLADPHGSAEHVVRTLGVLVLLKGSTTVFKAKAEASWEHRSHEPGLGMSGSGDVLAGIVTGLIARGADVRTAAGWGVAIHRRCGERLGERFDEIGYLATDMLDEIPRAVRDLRASATVASGPARLPTDGRV